MKTILLLIMVAGLFKNAAAFRLEYGNNLVISKPVYEDLYIAGNNITINAPVYGDLIIAGGTVIINDTVTNDILLVAGTVTFNGYVGDDIRCAGGNIRITKNIKGDVVVTGGTVNIDKAVSVGGLLASGGNIILDGTVAGTVKGAFGDLLVNGNVFGDLDCRAEKITVNSHIRGKAIFAARDITIGQNALFYDDIRYWNNKAYLEINALQKYGKLTYDPSLRVDSAQWYYLGAATLLGLLWYIGMAFIMIMILQYLFSFTLKQSADTFFNSPLKSLGFGLIFFFGVPLAALVSLITVIGVPVGLLLIFMFIISLLLATVISSLVAANWFNNRSDKGWSNLQLGFTALGVFIIFKLLSMLPFVGWLVMGVIVCMAFGAILLNIKWKHRRKNNITI